MKSDKQKLVESVLAGVEDQSKLMESEDKTSKKTELFKTLEEWCAGWQHRVSAINNALSGMSKERGSLLKIMDQNEGSQIDIGKIKDSLTHINIYADNLEELGIAIKKNFNDLNKVYIDATRS